MSLTFQEYQENAGKTAIYQVAAKAAWPDLPKEIHGLLSLAYVGLGLGESGETQNLLKKILRGDTNFNITLEITSKIRKEMGDQLWYLAELASLLGEDLGKIAADNLKKLNNRKETNTLQGFGDTREKEEGNE